jgi:hypothetical protein
MAGEDNEGAGLDAYARKSMAAGETVLGFHKQVSRLMLYALGECSSCPHPPALCRAVSPGASLKRARAR